MDILYAGVGGQAARRRVAAATAAPVAAAIAATGAPAPAATAAPASVTVASPLPELRALSKAISASTIDVQSGKSNVDQVPSNLPRFATFKELGMDAPLADDSMTNAQKPLHRFATFKEVDMDAAVAVNSAPLAHKSLPRFATFEELGMNTPMADYARGNSTWKSSAHAGDSTPAASRFATFQELGLAGDPYACHGKNMGDSKTAGLSVTRSMSVTQHWTSKKQLEGKKHHHRYVHKMGQQGKSAADPDSDGDSGDESARPLSLPPPGKSAGDIKFLPDLSVKPTVRTKPTARMSSASPSVSVQPVIDSTKSIFNMASGEFIDARTLALAPPPLVTGDAYALSVKGVKRSIKAIRGKVGKGGPALVSFSSSDAFGRQGLSDAQVAMLSAIEASAVQSDGQLSALADGDIYAPILPVGAAQKLGFRYAKKRLIPTTVSRGARKYRVVEGKPLAGLKVVHFGGLQNVGSKRDFLVKSRRKESRGSSVPVLKGAPVTLSFHNALNGRNTSITMDNVLEMPATGASNARLWYALLDSTTGPLLVAMRFSDTSLAARLVDVLFVYAAEIDLKANGASIALLSAERALATRFGALVDEMVVSGFEESHVNEHLGDADDQAFVDADASTFKRVLTSLQSLVACPSSNELTPAQRSALATYMGALSACVHAHMAEMHGEVDSASPVGMVAEGDALSVESDETRAASADMAHAMSELAGDLVALGLDNHCIAIRAGHLYEAIFENLQCGQEIAGYLGETDSLADGTDTVDAALAAEDDVSHLALISLAHVLGNVAAKSGHTDAIDALWTSASETRHANYETLLNTHFA